MNNDPIRNLLHLYEDGALNRRDLITRLTRYTGTLAAATALVEKAGLAQTARGGCPDGVRVPENDPEVYSQRLSIHGEGGPLFVYLSLPRTFAVEPLPAVLVIHENRGINEHIRDVTRRVAK